MKPHRLFVPGLLAIALVGTGCPHDPHPNTSKAEYRGETYAPEGYQNSLSFNNYLTNVKIDVYAPALSAADIDGDGLVDLLSTDNYGNIYVHKNLGNGLFGKVRSVILRGTLAVSRLLQPS